MFQHIFKFKALCLFGYFTGIYKLSEQSAGTIVKTSGQLEFTQREHRAVHINIGMDILYLPISKEWQDGELLLSGCIYVKRAIMNGLIQGLQILTRIRRQIFI